MPRVRGRNQARIRIIMQEWIFNSDKWPGARDNIWLPDEIWPGETGRFAAVVYSVQELLMSFTCGLLVILKGPPENPGILFRPGNGYCMAMPSSNSWFSGDRYLVSQAFIHSGNYEDIQSPLLITDLEKERYTYYPIFRSMDYDIEMSGNGWALLLKTKTPFPGNKSHDGKVIEPSGLNWHPWATFDRHVENYFAGDYGIPS